MRARSALYSTINLGAWQLEQSNSNTFSESWLKDTSAREDYFTSHVFNLEAVRNTLHALKNTKIATTKQQKRKQEAAIETAGLRQCDLQQEGRTLSAFGEQNTQEQSSQLSAIFSRDSRIAVGDPTNITLVLPVLLMYGQSYQLDRISTQSVVCDVNKHLG